MQNADLWKKADDLPRLRHPGHVIFTKVKRHASMDDVAHGDTTITDKLGNGNTDALAVAAAVVPHVLRHERKQVLWRSRVITQVQKMMVDILRARQTALAIMYVSDETTSDTGCN